MDREFKNARHDMQILSAKHAQFREEMTKSVMKGVVFESLKIFISYVLV